MMHTDLEVYKASMLLVKHVYELAKDFPHDELWGLTSQMKRAATSIPTNIAEGAGRKSKKELLYFLNVSLGSLSELQTQLDIAVMLDFVKDKQKLEATVNISQSVKRQLLSLIKANDKPDSTV
ncbi:MAG: four helix bundle protein [Candidatus Cloacimonetes bacterium HGW-Cloacimonetes-3]|nr:MAG: four helix bundle protein [Candidatus Cloacimonetes bacterium HGW-Cloacimonetes-3]